MLCLPQRQLHSFTSSFLSEKSLLCQAPFRRSQLYRDISITDWAVSPHTAMRNRQSGRDLPCPGLSSPPKLRSIAQLFCRHYTVLVYNNKKSSCVREHETKELIDVCKGLYSMFPKCSIYSIYHQTPPISHSQDEKCFGLMQLKERNKKVQLRHRIQFSFQQSMN